jgi:hypothetical protein
MADMPSLPIWLALLGAGVAAALILKRQPSVVSTPPSPDPLGYGWTWDQSLGILSYGANEIGRGYSGSDLGKNNPQYESIPSTGPIPQGAYTIQAPVDDPHMGPFALGLTPDPDQDMYGRAGFFIHGDSIEHPGQASEGCIILSRAVREQIWSSGDTRLQVVA